METFMKKLFTLLLTLSLIICIGAVLVACDEDDGSMEKHTHSFVIENTENQFLKEPATCQSGAVYRKSCSCGKAGDETFTVGQPIECVKAAIAEEKYLKTPGTCTTQAEYYVSCNMCKRTFDETFFAGDAGHNYVDGICTVCSQPKPHEHTFSDEWVHNEYEHWHESTCEHEGEISDSASHSYVDGVCSVCDRPDADTHQHTFETEWSADHTYHYFAATCEHTYEKKDMEKHDYVNGICSVCDFNLASLCEYELNADGESYTLKSFGYSLFAYEGDIEFTLPSTYDGKPVTAIGAEAFRYCSRIKTVIIPEGVTVIGNSAFDYCEDLESITLPSTLTSIGDSAFWGCQKLESVYIPDAASWCNIEFSFSGANPLSEGAKLYIDGELATHFVIPEGVTKINGYIFKGYKHLTGVTIPSSVTEIGASAFNGCTNLTSVKIPEKVERIEDYAFYECYRLVEVYDYSTALTIEKNSSWHGYVAEYALVVHIEDSPSELIFTEFDGYRFLVGGETEYLLGYNGSDTELVLPETSPLNHPYEIYRYTFYEYTDITSVTIPAGVTKIGSSAFMNCEKLESVSIDLGVNYVGSSAFKGCVSLKSVVVPSSVETIGAVAFEGCSALESVTLSKGIKVIEGGAFKNCVSLTSITVPSTVTNIGSVYSTGVFEGCSSLASITLPDVVLVIEGNAFKGTAYYNNPESWENGLLYIGKHLVSASQDISGVCTIKDGTLSIAGYAFLNCSQITEIIIAPSVEQLGTFVFQGCSGITKATMPTSAVSALRECPITVAVINGGTHLQNSAFYMYTKLTTLTIPNSVTEIGRSVFNSCEQLETINLPSTIVSIGYWSFNDTAFYKNEANWDADGVLYLGNYLIKAKNTLSGDYSVKDGTTVIAEEAFSGCNITGLVIPDSVKTIGYDAFEDCYNLKTAHIGAGVTLLDFAFANCRSLESVTVAVCDGWHYIDNYNREISHIFSTDPAVNAEFVIYNRKLWRN